MSVLLAVDPGIDVTGWAAFRTDGPRTLVLQQAADRLLAKGSLRSTMTDDLPARIRALAQQLTAVIVDHGATWVAIERPAIGGTYDRHAQGQTGFTRGGSAVHVSLAPMHVATGALILAAQLVGATVILVPASRKPKALRHRDVYLVWPQFHHASNSDERDALYIGLQLVTDTRRDWKVA